MYNEEGEAIWERSLDSYGKSHYQKGAQGSCPFMYQGQYEDTETGLYYNRFRYYDPEDGRYISVDPIGLLSGEANFYSYVDDPNGWIDVHGLKKAYTSKRKRIDLDDRGSMSAFNGKQGIYVHRFESGKVYVGQAGDMRRRPRRSLEEVRRDKGADDAGDTYVNTRIYIFNDEVDQAQVDALENKILSDHGGHRSPRNYNTRSAPRQ